MAAGTSIQHRKMHPEKGMRIMRLFAWVFFGSLGKILGIYMLFWNDCYICQFLRVAGAQKITEACVEHIFSSPRVRFLDLQRVDTRSSRGVLFEVRPSGQLAVFDFTQLLLQFLGQELSHHAACSHSFDILKCFTCFRWTPGDIGVRWADWLILLFCSQVFPKIYRVLIGGVGRVACALCSQGAVACLCHAVPGAAGFCCQTMWGYNKQCGVQAVQFIYFNLFILLFCYFGILRA